MDLFSGSKFASKYDKSNELNISSIIKKVQINEDKASRRVSQSLCFDSIPSIQ